MNNRHDIIIGNNPRIDFLGVNIDVLSMDQTVNLVETYILRKEPLHLIGVNADKINEALRNGRLKNIINRCGVINADGASVVLASKFLNTPLPERVAGIDLMMRLIQLASDKGYSVYLVGAKPEIVKATATELKRTNRGLNICGFRDGYFKEEEWDAFFYELERASPDLVFVGITSPTKEYFIEYLQNKGSQTVFMGVGGSFDVISGSIKRAPLWLQKLNLEWLYRVIQEPKRLGKRYFVGNFEFVKLVLKHKFRLGKQ